MIKTRNVFRSHAIRKTNSIRREMTLNINIQLYFKSDLISVAHNHPIKTYVFEIYIATI